MKRLTTIRWYVHLIPLFITVVMWLISKQRPGGWDGVDFFRGLSQVTALLVLNAYTVVIIMAARNRAIEKIYGGLDKSYKTHGQIAKVAFFVMLAHPLLLIPSMAERGIPWTSLLLPVGPWAAGFENARLFGVIAYYGFILLVLLTLFRRMDYQHWLLSHKFMGIFYVAAVAHTYMANSDVRAHEGLRTWITICVVFGLSAWLYKAVFYSWAAQQYRYIVESAKDIGGIIEINLKPTGRRINHEPGEFAFISVRNNPLVSNEHHPFSISSDSTRHLVRFSVRPSGNYTKSLVNLQPGDEVNVYGPYGEFTSYVLDEYKTQVWIAGGIGVTPFLAMFQHECINGDQKQVFLIYSGKKKSDLVYDGEIRQLMEGEEVHMHYIPHASDDEGFLTADRILKEVGDPTGVPFLLCGPPIMMQTLKKQLLAKGIPAHMIIFEEFNFV